MASTVYVDQNTLNLLLSNQEYIENFLKSGNITSKEYPMARYLLNNNIPVPRMVYKMLENFKVGDSCLIHDVIRSHFVLDKRLLSFASWVMLNKPTRDEIAAKIKKQPPFIREFIARKMRLGEAEGWSLETDFSDWEKACLDWDRVNVILTSKGLNVKLGKIFQDAKIKLAEQKKETITI